MKLTLKIISFFFLITPVIQAQKLLELIDAEKAGIDFKNTIKESGKYNHVIWDYVYNGAGVAIGDINNDGLADIFFTGNQVADRLYLNKGTLCFEDITANLKSNTPHFWSAGVTMADVNADGWLDIYVCRFEPSTNKSERRNLLYINNGESSPLYRRGVGSEVTFTEKAEEFGLADTGYSVQSAFFDHDNDGDLDCFVVNQPPSNNIEKLNNRTSASICTEYSNKLYRNNGGKYEDITIQAGLESCSYGLGLVISDLNNDGWPDIYVSNDYFVSDFAFINQKDGNGSSPRYKNQDKSLFKHESLYSMGVDIADFNNDGLADVFTADMSAADHYRNKANMASMNTQRFDEIIKSFNHQYMFNTLQLNRGNGNFSEIAQLAGVANTDWSWSSLFIDIDNDSNKDLFVTNGIKRDIRFVDGMNKTRDMMATGQIKLSEIINNIPSQKLSNYAFQNKKDLHFENKAADWGFDQPSFSNGMAYGDLDNDGDLDLVVNNVDDLPFIYKNNSTQNYLRIKLEGEKNNVFGYGAKAIIYYTAPEASVAPDGRAIVKASMGQGSLSTLETSELNPTRGFLSSSEPILHFGLGNIEKIDSVVIIWNDKSRSKLTNVKANQVLKISQKTAKSLPNLQGLKQGLFVEKEIIDIIHIESTYNDFAKEVLLPNKLSEIGPALAVADANGDGLEDIFVGGGKGQNSRMLFQNPDGSFKTETFDDANQEKTKALFFDANKDGHLDLYVACASNEFPANSLELQDKLYLNVDGRFKLDSTALPKMRTSTGAVAIDKTNNNLFVGGMMQQQKYPFAEKSKIIQNGIITNEFDLRIIRDAIWTDFDHDGDQDLIAVGEWTNIQILENIDGKLSKKLVPSLEKTTGFWHSIKAKDFDNDGDEDYVLGNLGLNNKFKKDAKKKFHVFSADFDENGVNDIVLAKVDEKGTLLPVRGRECSSQQMPFIAQKIKTFDEFAKSTLNEIYTPEKLSTALHYEVNEMGSIYVENLGNGNFQYKLLPTLAQFSVITDMLIEDFDHDGNHDILAVGNKYEAEVETARYDASLGVFLKGDGKGNFQALEVNESGFSVSENSRNLAKIKIKDKNYVVVGVNNGKFKFFEIR
jgi:enediyne biosynthesis protein E4